MKKQTTSQILRLSQFHIFNLLLYPYLTYNWSIFLSKNSSLSKKIYYTYLQNIFFNKSFGQLKNFYIICIYRTLNKLTINIIYSKCDFTVYLQKIRKKLNIKNPVKFTATKFNNQKNDLNIFTNIMHIFWILNPESLSNWIKYLWQYKFKINYILELLSKQFNFALQKNKNKTKKYVFFLIFFTNQGYNYYYLKGFTIQLKGFFKNMKQQKSANLLKNYNINSNFLLEKYYKSSMFSFNKILNFIKFFKLRVYTIRGIFNIKVWINFCKKS